MSAMKATQPLLRCYFLLLLSCHFWWALASAQNGIGNVNTPPNVLEAIDICREKLIVDPHFPRIQHSLAQLLDSQISSSDVVDTDLVDEVIQLYHAVGRPSSEVTEKRLPPAKVRFEALTRAGTIAKDILHDTPQAIKYFSLAIHVDGIEESSLLSAFDTIMPIIISSVQIGSLTLAEVMISPNGDTSENENQQAQIAFDLCDTLERKCPTATIVDEYRGAILRKTKQPTLAFESYLQAMLKSKQNMMSGNGDNERGDEDVNLLGNFVKTSILVAAAAREGGLSAQRQMNYLTDAEEIAVPLLGSLVEKQGIEQHTKESLRDKIVDLYNNMGIVEKKQGSLSRARELFRKALEINPKDGHALVQLASVDNGNDIDEVISNAKDLDPEYVGALFDGYSSRFESELVDVLQYTGHISVFRALVFALKQMDRSPPSTIIDLGCGTGLLGELIANNMPRVEISGVDLSARMVEIARERKVKEGRDVYTSVSNEDAATYLSALEKQSVDCILASDVFIYIGDIANVLEESSKCLGKDGLVGFTVESYEGSKDDGGLRLLKSGRFGHSRTYIDEVANSKGFEVLSWDDCVLRKQGNKDVKGAAVILKR